MKILQLCNKPPLPAIDGGCLAMDALTQGFLKNGHEVKVLCISTDKHPFKREKLDDKYFEETRFEAIYIDTKVNIVDAFSNLVTQDSYNISRFFSPDFDMRLKYILQREKFDVIQFESLFMTPYLATAKRYSKAKKVLRSHNLEHLIWKRLADGTKNVAKRFYLKHLAAKLQNYELNILHQMDGIITISKDDFTKYKELQKSDKNLLNIPFGINLAEYEMDSSPGEVSLFHLGSLAWIPNLEGVTWFLEEVWKKIQPDFPLVKFYLAGRKIPDEIAKKNYPNVVVIGEVDDAKEFIKSKAIMIVPVLSAGGMRVKIIEGLALGKTVISTTLGAEGIDLENNKHAFIADTKEEFVAALKNTISQADFLKSQMEVSRNFAETYYNNDKLVNTLLDYYKTITA